MKVNQKGFSVVEILVVTVIVGLLGAVGWLVYDKHKTKTVDTSNTSNTQVGMSQKATTPKQRAQEADPNEGYLVLKEWGLRFKTPSGLTDVRYTINGDTVGFFAKPTGSSVEYVGNYDEYKNSNFTHATGVLYRSTDATKLFDGNDKRDGKKIGNYYYYTNWAFSSLATGAGCAGLYGDGYSDCQTEAVAFQLVNQGDTALLNKIELAQ